MTVDRCRKIFNCIFVVSWFAGRSSYWLALPSNASLRNIMQASLVGDEGLEAFGSYPLFNRQRPVLIKPLGAHTGAKLPLSQVVALLIERWSYMTPEEQGAVRSTILLFGEFGGQRTK